MDSEAWALSLPGRVAKAREAPRARRRRDTLLRRTGPVLSVRTQNDRHGRVTIVKHAGPEMIPGPARCPASWALTSAHLLPKDPRRHRGRTRASALPVERQVAPASLPGASLSIVMELHFASADRCRCASLLLLRTAGTSSLSGATGSAFSSGPPPPGGPGPPGRGCR